MINNNEPWLREILDEAKAAYEARPEWAKRQVPPSLLTVLTSPIHKTNMNTTPPRPIQATLIDHCNAYRGMALDLENRVRTLKRNEELIYPTIIGKVQYDVGECIANIVLAIRHIEDARMRLGKVIQARDGGVSCYQQQEAAHAKAYHEENRKCLASAFDMKNALAKDDFRSAEEIQSSIAGKFAQINAELKSEQLQAKLKQEECSYCTEGSVTVPCAHCNGGAK